MNAPTKTLKLNGPERKRLRQMLKGGGFSESGVGTNGALMCGLRDKGLAQNDCPGSWTLTPKGARIAAKVRPICTVTVYSGGRPCEIHCDNPEQAAARVAVYEAKGGVAVATII